MKSLNSAMFELWSTSAQRWRESAEHWKQFATTMKDDALLSAFASRLADQSLQWAKEDDARAVTFGKQN